MIVRKFFKGFVYASAGIAYAFRSQVNIRFHTIAALLVIILSVLLKIDPYEWCIVLLCIASVFSAELINTSLETTVDLISPEKNEKAGQSKDVAAAAVLIVSIMSGIIGCIIFIPKIIHLFRS